MTRKRMLAWVMAFALAVGYFPLSPVSTVEEAQAADTIPIYQDKSYSFDERAADLVARMTMAEKASQVQGSNAAGIPRLGISNYQWWNEAIHGFSRSSGVGNPPGLLTGTSYPVSYALGASWNPELYYDEAREIGREIRERSPGNNLNLNMYSPTINLGRDARWGRNDESYSEDPFLTGIMGATFVQGVEGKVFNLDPDANVEYTDGQYQQASTTIKHYAANNSERNRTWSGADNVDLRAIREYYTRAYRDVIDIADVTSVMTAYSSIDGVPVSYSSYFMDTLLRQ
ncbi:MAG: hypothetical protein LBH39_03375, partial [Clostridiales Family XIII bacterium]|nr:hypothetical protein [Clostridiales Family XIII bacterium]